MPVNKYANAADLIPLANHLEDTVGRRARNRVFAELNVPLELLERTDSNLPYSDVCALYENAARVTGDPVFGARCGQNWGVEYLGPIGQYTTTGANLRDALRRLASAVSFYESGSHISLESHCGLTKFCYFPGFGTPVGRSHYADAVIGVMFDIVRHYTGSSWLPTRIGTDNKRHRYSSMMEDFYEVPIEFELSALSLTFPSSDLDTPNPCPGSACDALTLTDVGKLLGGAQPKTTVEAVTEVVRMRLLGGLIDIEGAARHMRLSVRTLQRQLSVEGASYRTIVARERYRRALDLLCESSHSITEISTALGYAYTSDFTRSFTRACGLPPSSYRSMRLR